MDIEGFVAPALKFAALVSSVIPGAKGARKDIQIAEDALPVVMDAQKVLAALTKNQDFRVRTDSEQCR